MTGATDRQIASANDDRLASAGDEYVDRFCDPLAYDRVLYVAMLHAVALGYDRAHETLTELRAEARREMLNGGNSDESI